MEFYASEFKAQYEGWKQHLVHLRRRKGANCRSEGSEQVRVLPSEGAPLYCGSVLTLQ